MMKCLYFGGIAAFVFAGTPVFAQSVNADELGAGARIDLSSHLAQWRSEAGENWRMATDLRSGYLEMLYGGSVEAPFSPEDDADWFQLARHFVQASAGMHAVNAGTLVDDSVNFLPLGQVNTTDKMSIRLRQEVGGVPVENGFMNLLFGMDGRLLSVQNTSAQIAPNANTTPAISEGFALRTAKELFESIEGVPGELGHAELVFARPTGPIARLAWNVDVHNDGEVLGTKFVIDAQSGQLLDSSTLIHHFDVTGQVTTLATDGLLPNSALEPAGPAAAAAGARHELGRHGDRGRERQLHVPRRQHAPVGHGRVPRSVLQRERPSGSGLHAHRDPSGQHAEHDPDEPRRRRTDHRPGQRSHRIARRSRVHQGCEPGRQHGRLQHHFEHEHQRQLQRVLQRELDQLLHLGWRVCQHVVLDGCRARARPLAERPLRHRQRLGRHG